MMKKRRQRECDYGIGTGEYGTGERAQGDVEQTFPCRVECHLAETTTTTTLDIDDEKRKKIHKIRKWKSLGEKILQFL